jgi:hypothetical protein
VAAATEQAGLPVDERPFEEHRRTQKQRLSGESWLLLAYVFWHWKRTEIAAEDYDSRQRAFHAALAAAPPSGFLESFSVNLSHAPWAADGSDGYEDWYLVQDFAALGRLNEAAVSASRAAPHDAVAALAAGGAGGLYALRCGAVLREPQYAHWFDKPEGLAYSALFAQLKPVVDQVQGTLWMRQMVLGPAREFCLHATAPVFTPAVFRALVIPVRQIWPEPANKGMEPPR